MTTTDVNQLLKQFKEVQKMMKTFGRMPKGRKAMRGVPTMPGLTR